jgi:hypothetical protein
MAVVDGLEENTLSSHFASLSSGSPSSFISLLASRLGVGSDLLISTFRANLSLRTTRDPFAIQRVSTDEKESALGHTCRSRRRKRVSILTSLSIASRGCHQPRSIVRTRELTGGSRRACCGRYCCRRYSIQTQRRPGSLPAFTLVTE